MRSAGSTFGRKVLRSICGPLNEEGKPSMRWEDSVANYFKIIIICWRLEQKCVEPGLLEEVNRGSQGSICGVLRYEEEEIKEEFGDSPLNRCV